MPLLRECRRCGTLVHNPPTKHGKFCQQCIEASWAKRRKHALSDSEVEILRKNLSDSRRYYKHLKRKRLRPKESMQQLKRINRFIEIAQHQIDTRRSMTLEHKAYLEMRIGVAKKKLMQIITNDGSF